MWSEWKVERELEYDEKKIYQSLLDLYIHVFSKCQEFMLFSAMMHVFMFMSFTRKKATHEGSREFFNLKGK